MSTRPPLRIVLASAGTGKTHQLTRHILGLLLRGATPQSVLAATFTRAAAAEIRTRILRTLLDAGTDPASLARLQRELDLRRVSPQQCQLLALSLLRQPWNFAVMTIDKLLLRLASSLGPEIAAIAGAPSTLEPATGSQATDLDSAAIDRMVDDASVDELAQIVSTLAPGRAPSNLASTLDHAIEIAKSSRAASAIRPVVWEREPALRPLPADQFQALMQELRAMGMPLTKELKPDKRWVNARDALVDRLARSNARAVLDTGLVPKLDAGTYCNTEFTCEHRELLQRVRDHARGIRLVEHADQTAMLGRVASACAVHIDQLKRERGQVDFDDIPRLLCSLGSLTPARLSDLYLRLNARFAHLALDEFQDTSLDQMAVLEPMIDELTAGDGIDRDPAAPSPSVMVVGDPKQTLYAWRGAEPGLMHDLVDRFAQHAHSGEALTTSFRSAQAVIDAVNTVFGQLPAHVQVDDAGASEPLLQAAAEFCIAFSEHTTARTSLAGVARLIMLPKTLGQPAHATSEPEEEPFLSQEPRWIAQRAIALQHELAFDLARDDAKAPPTVAVLVRRNKSIRPIIDCLRNLGCDASEEGGSSPADAPVVRAILDVLRFAEHPASTMLFERSLRSPLGVALRDRDGQPLAPSTAAEHVRDSVSRDGLARTLARWRTLVAPSIDAQGMQRLEQLLELAIDWEQAGRGDATLAAFVRMVESERRPQQRAASIVVTTIHRSKGLQYDGVVLADLQQPWELRSGQLLLDDPDPESGQRHAFAFADQQVRAADERIRSAFDATLRRHVLGELCVLYVGMTRAKQALEAVVEQSPGSTASPSRIKCSADLLVRTLGSAAWSTRTLAPIDNPTASDNAHATTLEHVTRPKNEPEKRPFRPVSAVESAPSSADPTGASRPWQPLRLRDAAPTWRLPTRSPSSMSAGPGGAARAIAAASPGTNDVVAASEPDRSHDPRERGLLAHAWLARVEWLDEDLPPTAPTWAVDVAQQLVPIDASLDRSWLWFVRSAKLGWAQVLRRSRYASGRWPGADSSDELIVLREQPFSLRMRTGDEARVVEGRFDRVVAARRDASIVWAEVVDFKTGMARAGSTADEIARHVVDAHRGQLEAYRSAAAAMLGLPAPDVAATVAVLDVGLLVPVPTARGRAAPSRDYAGG